MNIYSMGIGMLWPMAARLVGRAGAAPGTHGRGGQPPLANSSPAPSHWVDRIRLCAPR